MSIASDMEIDLKLVLLTMFILTEISGRSINHLCYLPASRIPIKSQNGDYLTTHYTGKLENGTVFDTSIGGNPFSFTLGAGEVIRGWDLGMLDMCVFERRKLVLPPSLAYGEQGIEGFIPPNTTIIFDVELLQINRLPAH